MIKKKSFFLIFILSILMSDITYAYASTRDGIIVEVPRNAFDNKGNLIDKKWESYLKERKPIGIIFFDDHFENRKIGKKIIKNIKNVINDDVILSADEEGGRVNRFSWLSIDSAEEVSEKYKKIKKEKGVEKAKKYVRSRYIPMFKEMRYFGLNTTFAPNLDLNKYSSLKKDSEEYKNYKKCVKYMKLTRIESKKIKKIDKDDYEKAWLFLAYLDEINVRKLSIIRINRLLPEKEKTQKKWKELSSKQKQMLIKQFKKLIKYVNYAAVIGDRSFGNDVKIVGEIGEIFVDTAKEFGINCVAKHALGHGRIDGDTHIEKQHSDASINDILHDIKPYIYLKNKINLIMPSHIIYDAVDDQNTAINSKKVLNFIREKVKKNVYFISDDISMNGADNEIQSPCDLLIVSNKSIDDVIKIGKKKRVNSKFIKKIILEVKGHYGQLLPI